MLRQQRTDGYPKSSVSNYGSEMGAAMYPKARSDGVNVPAGNALTSAYAASQQPCTFGGGVRDEEAGSSTTALDWRSTPAPPRSGISWTPWSARPVLIHRLRPTS